MLKNKKGFLLIVVYLVIAVLLTLLGVFVFKNIWEAKSGAEYKQRMSAFYCAEAALDKGIERLPSNLTGEANVALNTVGGSQQGEYTYTISVIDAGKSWRVESWGFVPNQAQAAATAHLEAYISKKDLPSSFWDNAIYTAGNVRVNGVAYDLNGDITYGGSLVPGTLDPANFVGTATNDPSVSPLVKLDYESLRTVAAGQIKADGSDNVYTFMEVSAGNPPFPTSFWFDNSDSDPTKWVPNVVYVETDLVLNGSIGTIGGFFLVVGDVTTDPLATSETIINGNGEIDGCVYSTGQFRVNGGGTGLNVLGGVWSGTDGVRLNGSIEIGYHQPYMNAIRDVIQPGSTVQLISWRKL
ncbi:MAG: pilus assembly PilX N-terminal domain-containing protein [Candidatus Omnitrophica bacterium]|nr:pilus assembly PilX N-terminal domain-containing protein [Candidatus Omnitrophota bacterium]